MNRIIRYSSPRSVHFNRSAFGGLETEVSRLFENALADFAPVARSPRFPVDIYADKDNTYVRAELPGVTREAINLEVADGQLTISGNRKEQDQDQEQIAEFSRVIALPDNVAADKVTAAYADGVLTVTLPKQEQAKPRKIEIAVN
jgi:HSP20 family protein